MLEFLSENPSMVLDRSVGGTSIRPNRDELWEKLASILNSCGPGAQKDGCGWRRVCIFKLNGRFNCSDANFSHQSPFFLINFSHGRISSVMKA